MYVCVSIYVFFRHPHMNSLQCTVSNKNPTFFWLLLFAEITYVSARQYVSVYACMWFWCMRLHTVPCRTKYLLDWKTNRKEQNRKKNYKYKMEMGLRYIPFRKSCRINETDPDSLLQIKCTHQIGFWRASQPASPASQPTIRLKESHKPITTTTTTTKHLYYMIIWWLW